MKKGAYSKLLITFIIILCIVFTIAFLYAFIKTGSEPVTLIGAFYTFVIAELWQLASIKKAKTKNGISNTLGDIEDIARSVKDKIKEELK